MSRTPADKFFAGPCDFVVGAASIEALPKPGLPEVAFAGRSNVGKSSLLNTLTARGGLAHVSKTPGRTQQLNYFNLNQKMFLVDMPGYGYAAVGKKIVAGWNRLILDYLKGRASLRRVCVLIDSRHGLKDVDLEVMDMLNEAAVSFQIVLTKADEPKPDELQTRIDEITAALKKHPAAYPEVMSTSSRTGDGISELRSVLMEFAKK